VRELTIRLACLNGWVLYFEGLEALSSWRLGLYLKKGFEPGVVAHTCNHGIWYHVSEMN
jgi:hypothetical protein